MLALKFSKVVPKKMFHIPFDYLNHGLKSVVRVEKLNTMVGGVNHQKRTLTVCDKTTRPLQLTGKSNNTYTGDLFDQKLALNCSGPLPVSPTVSASIESSRTNTRFFPMSPTKILPLLCAIDLKMIR